MIVLIKALQVILALSILILVHEFGHFFFAKIFHIRVDKFFLFFDIGGKYLFSTKSKWFTQICPKAANWETEYGIGLLPLGGYCKISGMVDESMDVEGLKEEPKEWEYRSKPAWQRLFVVAGGVLFNFIFATLIFSCMLASQGTSYISNEGNSIYVNELAHEMGFRNGDQILSLDDYIPENFNELQSDLARRNVRKVTVLRDQDTVDLYIDRNMIGQVLNTPGMFDLAVPFVIDTVPAGTVNGKVALQRGDRIININGKDVEFVQDSRSILAECAGSEVNVTVLRGADTLKRNMQVDSTGRLGVYMMVPGLQTKDYNALEAIPAGIQYTYELIRDYVRDLALVANPSTEAYKSVGSFVAIGQVFPSTWDWAQFLYLLGLLSIILGVMNLLPIPALDGGHIVFTLYEMISGRKPSDKFMIAAQMVGMVLIFALMFLALGNDIGRIIK